MINIEGIESGVDIIARHAPEKLGQFDYYGQNDLRYGETPYTVTGDPDQTIALSGCVPTLQATILANLRGMQVDPPALARWNIENGFRTPDNGTQRVSWNLLAAQAILQQEIVDNNLDAIKRALSVGGFVIASLKTPDRSKLGTPSGHVVGVHTVHDSSHIQALDVNSPAKSQELWAVADVLPHVNSRLRHVWAPEPLANPPILRRANGLQRLRTRLVNRG